MSTLQRNDDTLKAFLHTLIDTIHAVDDVKLLLDDYNDLLRSNGIPHNFYKRLAKSKYLGKFDVELNDILNNTMKLGNDVDNLKRTVEYDYYTTGWLDGSEDPRSLYSTNRYTGEQYEKIESAVIGDALENGALNDYIAKLDQFNFSKSQSFPIDDAVLAAGATAGAFTGGLDYFESQDFSNTGSSETGESASKFTGNYNSNDYSSSNLGGDGTSTGNPTDLNGDFGSTTDLGGTDPSDTGNGYNSNLDTQTTGNDINTTGDGTNGNNTSFDGNNNGTNHLFNGEPSGTKPANLSDPNKITSANGDGENDTTTTGTSATTTAAGVTAAGVAGAAGGTESTNDPNQTKTGEEEGTKTQDSKVSNSEIINNAFVSKLTSVLEEMKVDNLTEVHVCIIDENGNFSLEETDKIVDIYDPSSVQAVLDFVKSQKINWGSEIAVIGIATSGSQKYIKYVGRMSSQSDSNGNPVYNDVDYHYTPTFGLSSQYMPQGGQTQSYTIQGGTGGTTTGTGIMTGGTGTTGTTQTGTGTTTGSTGTTGTTQIGTGTTTGSTGTTGTGEPTEIPTSNSINPNDTTPPGTTPPPNNGTGETGTIGNSKIDNNGTTPPGTTPNPYLNLEPEVKFEPVSPESTYIYGNKSTPQYSNSYGSYNSYNTNMVNNTAAAKPTPIYTDQVANAQTDHLFETMTPTIENQFIDQMSTNTRSTSTIPEIEPVDVRSLSDITTPSETISQSTSSNNINGSTIGMGGIALGSMAATAYGVNRDVKDKKTSEEEKQDEKKE